MLWVHHNAGEGQENQSNKPSLTAPGSSSLTQNVGLKLQQLPHEGQVGGDDATALFHKVEGLI